MSGKRLYERVVEALSNEIVGGNYEVDQRLPQSVNSPCVLKSVALPLGRR